ncbi:GFA family protein [Mesorhizobium australicum]|uniref:Uncharacterized conserved protein n=1 Tax=Mesorhizobium australicum TaxID=536018 RepID=A0A1X7P5H1_9HYPH|nr:GFA family protein [Mesorhizobium australicum]SMH45932.1 Uncharacterized conserved protein [Mesorhizobium australicum]
MKIDGSCHCGAIAYEAEIDPAQVRICHCTDCQVLSGTAFRITAPAREQDFRLLRGEPAQYLKTAESGRVRIQAFCRDCGSPLYATSAGEGPRIFGIRAGTIRQRRELTPRCQFWHRSALPWLPDIACAEAFDTQ